MLWGCAHHPAIGMSWGNMGHTASFSSTLTGRSRWLSRRQCRSSLFVYAETLKACALIGLHLLATEDEAGSSGSLSPDFGRHVETRSPRKPLDGKRRHFFICAVRTQRGKPCTECCAPMRVFQDFSAAPAMMHLNVMLVEAALKGHVAAIEDCRGAFYQSLLNPDGTESQIRIEPAPEAELWT